MQWNTSLGHTFSEGLSETQGVLFINPLHWLPNTFLFSYYDLEVVSDKLINKFLSNIVEKIVNDLSESYCLIVDEVWDGI